MFWYGLIVDQWLMIKQYFDQIMLNALLTNLR